jgi:hypothetical protein
MTTHSSGGAVAIWHDIVSEGLTEFYSWHGEEHMPERVGIPGFLRGRRFIAVDADLGFFNLYETNSPEAVKSTAYKAALDNPTPRTLSAVKHFRTVARSLCHVAARSGAGQGGVIATLRYDVPPANDASHFAEMTSRVVGRLATLEGIASVMLLATDREASGYVNAEQRARGVPNTVPSYTLIIEGWGDETDFIRCVKSQLDAERMPPTERARLGFYRHQLTVSKSV